MKGYDYIVEMTAHYPPPATISKRVFLWNLKRTFALEFLENLENMFSRYYVYSDVLSMIGSSTTQWCITSRKGVYYQSQRGVLKCTSIRSIFHYFCSFLCIFYVFKILALLLILLQYILVIGYSSNLVMILPLYYIHSNMFNMFKSLTTQ